MDETTPGQWTAPSDGSAEPASPSPFAPPTLGAPAPPPPPALDETAAFPGLDSPTTSVVVDEPPKKSRKGLVVALALVAVAALGAGAFFVFKGDSSNAFALDEAAANAAAAHGAKS
ncbi:MAG: hypothetical protein RJA49_421, partial [Actinomycetota bacterium]